MVRILTLLALAAPAFAQQLTWTIASAIRPNTNFSVTVKLQAGNNPAALQFTVTIPPATTFVGGNNGATATASGKGLRCGPVTNSNMICIVWGLNTNVMADGTLAGLVFKTTAAPGSLVFGMLDARAASAAGDGMPLALAPPIGILVIANCDFNGDGAVTAADTSAINSQVVAAAPRLTCDMNGDGVCDVDDIQIVVAAAQPGAMCTATSRGPGA